MQKFKYNMHDEIAPPTIVLSTKYHKHLGIINNISNNIANEFNMSSHQEISFDVYKTLDGVECELWEQIVDLKYIYVPEHNEYYEIQVTIDDADNTIKHCVGMSAGECELSQRYLRDFHCNDETDILFPPKYQVVEHEVSVVDEENGVVDFEYDTSDSNLLEDQDVQYTASVIYRPIYDTDSDWLQKKKHRSSLLHRVLHDKCPDWSIGHIDDTLMNVQRTFTADDNTIYDFLTGTVATEIGCLFQFDSVNRKINVYDLKSTCNKCGHRGEWIDKCPKCGSTDFIRGYGAWKKVYVSPENTALQMTVDGDADSVKNCFKISGGDDLMTATVVNINPNRSPYIYRFSDDMKADMPEELVQKLDEYETMYQEKLTEYTDLTDQWYKAVDDILNLQSKMMPETSMPTETTAEEQLAVLINATFTVAVQNINTATDMIIDNSVAGYAKVLIDPRYTVEVSDTTLTPISGGKRTWTGKFTVKSLGGLNKDGKPDEATSTNTKSVVIIGDNGDDYEQFLYQKIVKTLDRSDAALKTLFDIESDDDFKSALELYCLDRLTSFSNTYQSILEVLTNMDVAVKNKTVYGVNIYDDVYLPYYRRKGFIDAEAKVREDQIKVLEETKKELETQRQNIQKDLSIATYLGKDLYQIFLLYLRENTYTNSNYISEGLDNSEVINKARELFNVAQSELIKASELQFTLTGQLANFLNTEEFKEFKDEFEIGDYIICKADDKLYRLRIVNVSYSYDNPADIQITFSNVVRGGNFMSDVSSILSKASSMATSYNYVAHQASQGNDANNVVKSFENSGLNSSIYNIIAGKNQDIVIDSHGITAREYDDTINDYSPEQLKITSHSLAFTTDNWETASLSLGRHSFTYWDINERAMVTKDLYGLSADFINSGIVVGSQIIAGYILSGNYNDTTKKGAFIDLDNGYFTFADGKLVFDQDGLSISAEIDASLINDATITDSLINNNDKFILSKAGNLTLNGTVSGTAWATKQDKLTAGQNITINDNVISATGGTDYRELTQAQYDALTPAEKHNGTIYFITDGEGGGGSKVIINPSGTATGVMNKISVDGIIYSVPTGVSDVRVNNTSVVTSGVANINLNGYATTTALTNGLATKQDTLTAGNNVSIANNVISATDTTYTAGTNITITNNVISATGGTEVEANPSGVPTDTLNTVDIGGTIYEIEGGGGGTGNVDDVYVNGTSVLDTNHIAQITSYKTVTQAEYDALPSSKLTDGILYCIEDTGIVEGDRFAPAIYSLEERQIGVWTNGKPLYQKTIKCGNISGSSASISLGISNIEMITFGESYFYSSSCIPFPYLHPNTANIVSGFFENNNTSLAIRVGNDMVGYVNDLTVTVLYTKTTDTPGSGDWTTSGVPAHHYSTEEQVVGTWIDGSTVYEKTVTGLSVTLLGNNWVNLVEIPNINLCLDVTAYSNDSIPKKCMITECHAITGDIVQVASASGFERTVATAVIRYTKTL